MKKIPIEILNLEFAIQRYEVFVRDIEGKNVTFH